jgi:signal transduction histidine kinase
VLRHPAAAQRTEPLPAELLPSLEGLISPALTSELEAVDPGLGGLFRAHGWEAGVPLRINDRLTGFVGLGRNRSFRIFSAEDLQLLDAVAAGASVALENAALSRQLRRSEAVLERANRLSSLGLLAAGIAHEIRNPLVAVKTFLDLLPQRLEDRDFLTNFRDLSLGELRRVTDLIADLLALGKSRTAERRALDVAPTLEPVVRLMESTARKRQIELAVDIDSRLPSVWADPDQLKQIALNLLLNAIDSSVAGGRVRLEVRRAPGDAVALAVRDEGAGIPPEQLETIFNPFFTTKETGTGLGLTLVHQMVVEHGGEITVESEVGRGSVFRVTLPGARVDLAATGT